MDGKFEGEIAVITVNDVLRANDPLPAPAVSDPADAAVPEQHPLVKKAKDVAAAGVLLAAMAAVIIGAVVFLPLILDR